MIGIPGLDLICPVGVILVHPATEYLQTRKGSICLAVNSPCGGF